MDMKKENEQMSVLYTLQLLLNNGTGTLAAIVRASNLARSFGWTEEEIEEFCDALELNTQFNKDLFNQFVKELD